MVMVFFVFFIIVTYIVVSFLTLSGLSDFSPVLDFSPVSGVVLVFFSVAPGLFTVKVYHPQR
jgi:hypothetical protein